MDVFSRSRTFRSNVCAAGIAIGCFAAGAFLLEGGAMNWREKIVAPVMRSIVKAIGLTEFARTFMRGDDPDGPSNSLYRPYANSVWVMSAIGQVTQPLKSVSLKFYRGDDEFQDKELAAFWRRPAMGLSYEEFIDATAGWFKLRGEFFWLLDDSWLTRMARKSKFIVARPGDMHEIVQGGELLGWRWSSPSGQQINFLPEQVVHARRWNPYNHFRGLGELEATLMAADSDYTAARFARDTFANAGTAGDYIFAKNGVPTEPQREQIIEALRQKRAALKRGEYTPVFLTGDIGVENPQVTAPDAAFVANRLTNRHEIYIGFGVPASMADVQASYSIGSASDYFRLIFNTCMPLAATIGGAIDTLVQRQAGLADLEAWFDFDEHPVMQAVRSERVDAAAKLWSMGMPLSLAGDYLDMGLPKFGGDDVSYLPFSVAPVNESAPEPKPAPSDPEVTEDPAVAAMLKVLSAPARKVIDKKSVRDPRRVALARQHEAARGPMEKAFVAKFKKVSMTARAEVLEKIKEAKAVKSVTKSVAADFLFDLIKFTDSLKVEMRKQTRVALQQAGQEMNEELGKDDVFSMPPHSAQQYLSQRENRIGDAAQETHDQIGTALQQGLDAGDTMDDLADRVRTAFNGIDKGRALTIARTETAAAYGTARDESMRQAGIQYKQWLTAGDDHVRASHLAAEAQIVELHEAFDIGGAALQFPGDPNGPAEEVINCRCVQIAVAKPENA